MWFFRPSRQWDWLQLEVSCRCPAACIYCPTALFGEQGSNRLMSMETFHRLLPAFYRSRMVFLQGWGEPFMNPHLFEMVGRAKAAGCRVGTTTNGMLLDGAKLTELVKSGMDIVALSLAGCTEKNDAVRKGTRLAHVLEAIRQLHRIKKDAGTDRPEIHVAYMLLRSGLDEVEQLPALLSGSGVSQVVVSTLDLVLAPELNREALTASSREEFAGLRARLDRLESSGRESGLEIRCQMVDFPLGADASAPAEPDITAFFPVRPPSCTENIQRAAFISAGGDVSPCVYTNLPLASPSGIRSQAERPYQPLIFGNVQERPLEEIWKSKAYSAFRRSCQRGQLEAPCRGCPKTMTSS